MPVAMNIHQWLQRPSPSTAALLLLPFALLAFIYFVVYPKEFELQSYVTSSCPTAPTTTGVTHFLNTVTVKPDFRLLVGILTRADLYERRHLLRLIYSFQLANLTAQVDVRFVFCNLNKEDQRPLIALEIMRYDDIIILNCTENMNEGKTYTYFASLPELFDGKDGNEPYDYVMKADDDIYVMLPRLVESLNKMPRMDMYYGFVIPCDSMDPFREYMSGMGYVLSWDLVQWISTSEIAKKKKEGPEDMMTGKWLNEAHKAKNRYNTKYRMYDYPLTPLVGHCMHEFVPDSIAVHKLKTNLQWATTLKYFNATQMFKPSKFYHID